MMKRWMEAVLVTAPLLAASPLVVSAQQPVGSQSAEEPRTLSVNATAVVDRAPDQAVIMLAVESEAESAREAAAANATKMDRVVSALKRLGIPSANIRTVSYELQPQYAQSENREPRIASYRALNQVQVTLSSIDRVGPTIDAALASGSNRVSNLSFGIEDTGAARLEALQKAVAKAKREAEAVATAAGQKLGVPLTIQVDGYAVQPPRPMPMYRMAADMAMAPPTPVEGGTIQVSASVSIIYRID
jgi:uncharacterized protein YggE